MNSIVMDSSIVAEADYGRSGGQFSASDFLDECFMDEHHLGSSSDDEDSYSDGVEVNSYDEEIFYFGSSLDTSEDMYIDGTGFSNGADDPWLNYVVWDEKETGVGNVGKVQLTKDAIARFLLQESPAIEHDNIDYFMHPVPTRILCNFVARAPDPFADRCTTPRRTFEIPEPSRLIKQDRLRWGFNEYDPYDRSPVGRWATEDERQQFLSYKCIRLFQSSGKVMRRYVSKYFRDIVDTLFLIFEEGAQGNLKHFQVAFNALLTNFPEALVGMLVEDDFAKLRLLIGASFDPSVSSVLASVFTNFGSTKKRAFPGVGSDSTGAYDLPIPEWQKTFILCVSSDTFSFTREMFNRLAEAPNDAEARGIAYFLKAFIDKIAVLPYGMELLSPFLSDEPEFYSYFDDLANKTDGGERFNLFIEILVYISEKSGGSAFEYSSVEANVREVDNSIEDVRYTIGELLLRRVDVIVKHLDRCSGHGLLEYNLLEVLVDVFEYIAGLVDASEDKECRETAVSDPFLQDIHKALVLVATSKHVSKYRKEFVSRDGEPVSYVSEYLMRFLHCLITINCFDGLCVFLGEDFGFLRQILMKYRDRVSDDTRHRCDFAYLWLIINIVRLAFEGGKVPRRMFGQIAESDLWAGATERVLQDTVSVIPRRLSKKEKSRILAALNHRLDSLLGTKSDGRNARYPHSLTLYIDGGDETVSLLEMQIRMIRANLRKVKQHGSNSVYTSFSRIENAIAPVYISINNDVKLNYFDEGTGVGSALAQRIGF